MIAMAMPYVEALQTARAAASAIYAIIDRVSPIDSSSSEGAKPERLEGEVTFRDVFFNYPARKDVKGWNIHKDVCKSFGLLDCSSEE